LARANNQFTELENMMCNDNKKDGYRQQNVRQPKAEDILPVRQINIWQAPIRVNFCVYTKDRK